MRALLLSMGGPVFAWLPTKKYDSIYLSETQEARRHQICTIRNAYSRYLRFADL